MQQWSGSLRSRVADDFDFLSFQAGIHRKKGKPPVIASRGNVYGLVGVNGPEISVNMGSRSIVAPNGSCIALYNGSTRHIEANFEREGMYARASFQTAFGQAKKFQLWLIS